ncbi:MAG TPA: SRPBCC domain-containing protein [Allosphingosinicella sp.]|nr:SRPBCC domain-containing protein [Allosphingosinicella sp.]
MLSFLIAAALQAAPAAPAPALRQGLEPLAFLVGHCWRGQFPGGEQDMHCFESVYGGQHVRDRHEVTGGARAYRGETLYSWDGRAGIVTYTYWNSSGGVSRGTMRPAAGRLDFGDETYTDPQGRRITLSTHWRRDGDAYLAATASPQAPSMNRTVRYARVDAPVAVATTRGGDGRHNLTHESIVDAPPADVWRAISTAEGWRTWAVPVAWAPEPDVIETSYTPTAQPGDPSTIRQRILAAVPERLLLFRTIRAPAGFPNFDTFAAVTSAFELEPLGETRTRVRLTGAGFADTEAGRQLLGFFREGNRVSLERLRRRFATGPLDWTAVLRQD